MPTQFRTLHGFLSGHEPDDEPYFEHSASLRISGEIEDLDSVSANLALQPTHVHRKGEPRPRGSAVWSQDMWIFTVDLPADRPLAEHIDALWLLIRDKTDYLLALKKTLNVDVFVGYRSNCDHAGFEIPHTSLHLFNELQVPLGVSVIIS